MENTFLKNLERQGNLTETQNGAVTHASTLSGNLDLFAKSLRYLDEEEFEAIIIKAVNEDLKVFVKNILYILDIRKGKGERRAFKFIIDKVIDLTSKKTIGPEVISLIMKQIPELGRHDYWIDIIDNENFRLVADTWEGLLDENWDNLLMWKWMPSTRGARKHIAKKIQNFTGVNEKSYRKQLSAKRAELNLIETALTTKNYDAIDLSKVPAKALNKYRQAFERNMEDKLSEFNKAVANGDVKINTTALFPYEVLKIYGKSPLGPYVNAASSEQEALANNQWNNMANFVPEGESAIVVADTSASMQGVPMQTSVGLALYFAERNIGEWQNKFITFSSEPSFISIPENASLQDKLKVIPGIIDSTDIDKVFELILDTAKISKESAESMPEHVIIISDMEFNQAASATPNFNQWKTEFENEGLQLPKLIFWNASQYGTQSMPVTKYEENTTLVSGFSTTVFNNLFELEEFTPLNNMLNTLKQYDTIIENI